VSEMSRIAELQRVIIAREDAENKLAEMVELGLFVALLAPIRTGRSALIRRLRRHLGSRTASSLFIILRPDQSPQLPREVFLSDLLAKLRSQLPTPKTPPPSLDDPYLELKQMLRALPLLEQGPIVVAVDDLGHLERQHLHTLLWLFRELHSHRADEGWESPLNRLAVVVAGSRKVHEMTIGHDNHLLSPFNIAEIYLLPAFDRDDTARFVDVLSRNRIVAVRGEAEVIDELLTLTGGHPALMKSLISEIIREGEELDRPRLLRAASALAHGDRLLQEMWERIRDEEEARALLFDLLAARLPPANLEMADDATRALYWSGWTAAVQGRYTLRGTLLRLFLEENLKETLARKTYESGEEGTNESPKADGAEPDGAEATDHAHGNGAPHREGDAGDRGGASTSGSSPFPDQLFPPGLLRGFSAGEGMLFVGAGASCAAGLPSWATLIDEMIAEVRPSLGTDAEADEFQDYVASAPPPAIAQLVRDRLGPFEFHRLLKRLLRRTVALAPIHHALRRLPVNIVMTTNFDKLLEKTYRTPAGDDPVVVVSSPQLAMIDASNTPIVIKMHGDIDDPDSIVLTSDDYRGFFDRHRALRAFLTHHFNFRTVLFVGFGLRDPNFELIFDEARRLLAQYKRPAYALMVDVNPFERQEWKRNGIEIIALESVDDVPVYLEELSLRVKETGHGDMG